jgi:hypothetical protein
MAPIVQFTDAGGRARKCELADLLLVVDIGSPGSFTRKAVLIQAKMARAATRVSLAGASSRVQLDLYQNWHKFDFIEAAYGMNQVDLKKDGGRSGSGTIGVIDRHLTSQPAWTQHAASPTPSVVVNQPHLGEFIAEMACDTRVGFGRLATPLFKRTGARRSSGSWTSPMDALSIINRHWAQPARRAAFMPSRV